jgi:hypothetical protein
MAHRDSQFLAALEQKKLGALCVMARPRPCMLHACAIIAGACISGDPVTVLAIFLIYFGFSCTGGITICNVIDLTVRKKIHNSSFIY